MPKNERKTEREKKTIWFFRPMKLYQRRYHNQYGHFIRDAILHIFWYMLKGKMLDNPRWQIKIYQNLAQFHPPFKEFIRKVFPNVDFGRPGETISKTERVMKYAPSHFKKFWNGTSWIPKRDERFNNYVKWVVDPFRDYCFKQLNFKPEKKKRLLYVPRINPDGSRSSIIENPHRGGRLLLRGKRYPNRFIDDVGLEERLKKWCKSHQYEFVHWQNGLHVPIEEQMKTYAESEIVIGPTGTDWINAYWCDSKTLLIEIIPPAEYHPGGDCETFKSEDQLNAVRVNKYNKFPKGWDLSNACERNLKLIYNDEIKTHNGATGRGTKRQLILSDKNKDDIIRLINDHISLSKDNS